jgi:hypothetical protein
MDNRTRGVVASVDYTTGLCTVTVAGVTISAQAVGQLPIVGAEAYLEKRGEHRTDWVITDVQNPGDRAGIPCSRYTFARTASGIAGTAFTDVGTPPSTTWSTGSVSTTHSLLTITKQCHLDLWLQWTNQFSISQTWTMAGNTFGGVHFAESQAGGAYFGSMHLSGLMDVGDVIDMQARNAIASLNNLIIKGVCTFTDITAGTIQT